MAVVVEQNIDPQVRLAVARYLVGVHPELFSNALELVGLGPVDIVPDEQMHREVLSAIEAFIKGIRGRYQHPSLYVADEVARYVRELSESEVLQKRVGELLLGIGSGRLFYVRWCYWSQQRGE